MFVTQDKQKINRQINHQILLRKKNKLNSFRIILDKFHRNQLKL